MASPAQAEGLLAAVARIRPALAAFFGCLYYGALRPEEAIALRRTDCYLPARGWGMLTLTRAAPRTAAAWTGNGTSHEQRGLKHRPEGSAGAAGLVHHFAPGFTLFALVSRIPLLSRYDLYSSAALVVLGLALLIAGDRAQTPQEHTPGPPSGRVNG